MLLYAIRSKASGDADGARHHRRGHLSYHISEEIRNGRVKILLEQDEYPPLPVHLLMPQGRLAVPKVRAFADFAAPRLKRYFDRLSREAKDGGKPIRSARGRVSAG